MKRTLACVLAVAFVGLLGSDARAGTWAFDDFLQWVSRSEWEGYGVGTTVHRRATRTRIREGEEPQVRVSETRQTLLAIGSEEVTVRQESRRGDDEEWSDYEHTPRLDKDCVVETADAGEETVAAGGGEYACAVKTVRVLDAESREVEQTWKVWTHAAKGIVKLQGGEARFSLTMTVASWDESFRVGDRTLTCIALDVEGGDGAETGRGRLLICPEVPGRFVRSELEITEKEGRITRQLEEIVSFEVK